MQSQPSRRQFLRQAGIASAMPAVTSTPAIAADDAAVTLVKGGKPVATIVSSTKQVPPKKGGKKLPTNHGESLATQLLVEWVKKITGAELPVAEKAPAEGVAIYVGKAAVDAGLKLDDIESPTKEGVRIVVGGGKVLIGGQSEAATVKAACRFLEELGCRYFMDSPLGEVFPTSPDLVVKPTTITEKPGLLFRNPKGPTWMGGHWKEWNGAGGEGFAHSHSWGHYIPKGLFAEHPEYFAQGADGQRKNGDWLCTSNPGIREVFANEVIAAIKRGATNPSISPPDGRGYCRCEKCVAQDDPKAIEPSSGTVSISTRYADFFDDVAQRVAKVYPDSVLNFYVYADYTQPPTREKKLAPNLCAVIAPIRYCRQHAIGNADCPSRKQQLDMIDGWSKVASRLGYYNYMYNLADATLPMFKFTPCKLEFPYLAGKGLAFMTIEVLSNWYLYGPQIYLSLRMAYDPKLDATAVMEDYYTKFYGPAAAHMKAYWTAIDDTTAKLPNHSGGFYGLASAYTPELIRTCETALARATTAAKEAKENAAYAERVAMHAAGFQNVLDYRDICDAMAKGDFVKAKEIYTAMTTRIGGLITKKQANAEYGTSYLRRFLLKTLDGGIAATAAPNKLLAVLPDKWKFAPDDMDMGESKGFAAADHDDSKWKLVATHSVTLSGQGIPENTVLWYRTKFPAPEKKTALSLVFTEVDGDATVYVNGKKLEPRLVLPAGKKESPNVPPRQRRAVFAVDLGDMADEKEIVVAVRCDNRKISELFLGGILRPALLVEKGTKSD